MKLTDLIHGAGGLVRDATNFIRYPIQIVSQQFRRVAQDKLEQVEVPFSQTNRSSAESAQQTYEPDLTRGVVEKELEAVPYRSSRTNVSKSPESEVIATLEGQKISGRRGKYQVERLLQDGDVRFYQSFWIASNLPVVIKEYRLLDWSDRTLTQAKDAIERIETVSLKSGGVQDFRLITPWDAWVSIDERRGYLLVRDVPENSTTLRQHVQFTGAMSTHQVRRVLAQVLQTLWFLHNHKIRFADGTVQSGLLHGNLNLDSLLIVLDNQQVGINEFQIYASDLELWEAPFRKPLKPISITQAVISEQVQQDLYDLGIVGFYLLVGEVYDRRSEQIFDPQEHYNWAAIPDVPLKQFIRQLLNLDNDRSLLNAEEASKALRNLPDRLLEPEFFEPAVVQKQSEQINSTALLGVLFFALLLGLLAWIGLRSRNNSPPLSLPGFPSASTNQPTGIKDVEPMQVGIDRSFKYAVSDEWLVAMQRRISFDRTLQAELVDRASPQLSAQLKKFNFVKGRLSDDALVTKLRTGNIKFFLSEQRENLPDGLTQEVVASDGLVVVVAFADSQESIPKRLQGKISFAQLQKIYAGEDFDYQVYAPGSRSVARNWSVVKKFQQFVFAPSSPENAQFENGLNTKFKVLSSNQMFERIFEDFQNKKIKKIGIGFERLSNVFGQCSVYPLALVKGGREFQPLIQGNGEPIVPQSDLCAKGSYQINAQAFERYPFSYRLSVVYAKSNDRVAKKMIELLTTDEGQCLLNEAGFVPIKPGWNPKVCENSGEIAR